MTEWVSVLLLLGLGLVLLLIELLFIPGTTFVGLAGLLVLIFGIVLSYRYFGSATGNAVLIGTAVVAIVGTVYSIRSGAWERFALKGQSEGRFNDGPFTLAAGDVGETTSVLRPIGKAEFANKLYEVRTLGNYVESGTKVKITHIDHTKIFVEPLTE